MSLKPPGDFVVVDDDFGHVIHSLAEIGYAPEGCVHSGRIGRVAGARVVSGRGGQNVAVSGTQVFRHHADHGSDAVLVENALVEFFQKNHILRIENGPLGKVFLQVLPGVVAGLTVFALKFFHVFLYPVPVDSIGAGRS